MTFHIYQIFIWVHLIGDTDPRTCHINNLYYNNSAIVLYITLRLLHLWHVDGR